MADETRVRILEAAIDVLGRDGARGLTIRAAESRAGVSHGSVRYYFGTHSALLREVLAEIIRQDLAAIPEEFDEASIAETITGILLRWADKDKVRMLARYELMLLGARQDDVRQMFLAAARNFVARIQEAIPELRDGNAFVAQIDGLLFELIARGPIGEDELLDSVHGVLQSHSVRRRPA